MYAPVNKGFTLLELAIVLTIIGLIAGGVVVGQKMVQAATQRSIAMEAQFYKSATMAFKEKYIQLPGDLKTATDFWSGVTNGNGDGMLMSGASGEVFQAWLQLANAGMIPGKFTGVADTGGNRNATINKNVPGSKLNGAGWSFYNTNTVVTPSHADRFMPESLMNRLEFGADTTNYETDAPILTTEDAWDIDRKVDDGLPGTGNLVVFKNGSTWMNQCSTTDDPATSKYNVSATGPRCGLVFVLDLL